MLVNSFAAVVSTTFLLASQVLGQTPAGSSPSSNVKLGVTYGTMSITPGTQLSTTMSSTIPTFSFPSSSPNATYILLLVDLSIPAAIVSPSTLNPKYQLPLAPGLGSNRSTRLHFFQAGLKFSPSGSLINTTQPIAYYNGPQPPVGDIAHSYVFYLFPQGSAFQAPPADSPFNVANVNSGMSNRMSFNVQTFAKQAGIGPLTAANYIKVQRLNSTATASASGKPSGTGSSKAPSGSPFMGEAGRVGLNGALSLLIVLGMGFGFLFV